MNAALLKIPSIRAGTSFAYVLPTNSGAHPIQPSAPSQSPLTRRNQPSEAAQAFERTALAHVSTPKAPSFVPTQKHPANTSAIGGLFN